MNVLKVFAGAFLIVSSVVSAAQGDFCPPQSRQSDGMRDIMLIYATPGKWGPDEFLPYVAYLDQGGQPRDWFYDAFLFLMYGGAPSGHTYIDGATDRKDWEFYLSEEFAPGREFAALDRTVGEAARLMGRAAPAVPVIAMIPYPSPKQKNFGDVDGDGTTEDLGADSSRVKAVAWFLRDFLGRWEAAKYRHLKLWGFYWMNEGIAPADEAVVKAAAGRVHALGYKFHWIPWFKAPGVEKWRELGFDLAIMQPNYAFIPPAGPMRVPDENRLSTAANICRRLGLGVEMELDMGIGLGAYQDVPVELRNRVNLQLYLDHGDDALDGYQAAAVRAYYQGSHVIAGLCRSRDPALRELYDDLYRFHRGEYVRRRPYQPWQPAQACLSDGRWRTRPEAKAEAVRLSGPHATLQMPLAAPCLVGDVRVHLTGDVAPQRIRLSLTPAAEGGAPAEVAALDDVVLHPEDGGGFAVLAFPARLARGLSLEFDMPAGATAEVDEILIMPAEHLLAGSPYTLDAAAEDPSRCLTDGVTGGAPRTVWRRGRGEMRMSLSDERYADSLVVQFRQPGGARFAPRVSLDGGASFAAADRAGVAVVPLNRPVKELALTFEDAAAGAVAVDEVALLPAKNLASDCAYSCEPPFRASYPDTGNRELTDGEVSKGFGDGKSVGWAKWSLARDVTVVVDLGESRQVDSVEAHVQGGGSAAVEFPERVSAAVSEDGRAWRSVAASREAPSEIVESRKTEGRAAALGWLRLATQGARGRFVRLVFQPSGWLMLSEVRVMSGGGNAAQNRTYTLRPLPTGEARYADNAGLLTDGYCARAGAGWKSCAGFDAADPTVTVDLGAVRRTAAARLHVQGGGPGGVYFPERLAVDTSVDGSTWQAGGETAEHPPEAGKAAAAFMGVTFAPRQARFVRFRVKRHGWAMLDELEILPAADE